MFEKFNKWLNGEEEKKIETPIKPIPEVKEVKKIKPVKEVKETKTKKKTKVKKEPKILTPKEQATLAGEPYVAILKVDLDPKDINNGSFDLDWNEKFLLNLIKQGYKFSNNDKDTDIVDRWFQTVCRNIALEVYEQHDADPNNRTVSDVRVINQKDLGDGRTEVS